MSYQQQPYNGEPPYAPLVPPDLSEAGAISIPRQLQRWEDLNPVTKLTRTQAFITLPAFSVTYTWNGFSDIVAAFNFEAPNNFSLKLNDVPMGNNPNYLLCVSWRTAAGGMFRYKLWSNVGEVLYFMISNYSGQLIKGNFRLEIWSVNQIPPNPIGQTFVLGTENGNIIGIESGGMLGVN